MADNVASGRPSGGPSASGGGIMIASVGGAAQAPTVIHGKG